MQQPTQTELDKYDNDIRIMAYTNRKPETPWWLKKTPKAEPSVPQNLYPDFKTKPGPYDPTDLSTPLEV